MTKSGRCAILLLRRTTGKAMEFEFENKRLRILYTDEKGAGKYPPEVVDAFFELMSVIDSAPDEREFRHLKYLHYEKLEGTDDRSMRLHGGWRLIVKVKKTQSGKTMIIKEISKHYGD